LVPSTTYYCQVISSNVFGVVRSSALIFSTSSRPESRGLINVYFNKSVDTRIATQQKAQGNVYLSTKLINRIDNAAFSIDATVYNFSLSEIGSALIRARQRGISVRIITDQENNTSEIQRLIRNGIPVIFDDFGSNDGTYRMHNKFAVFDARDFTLASDDWVWTGSYNFTYSGTTKNAENVVEIQDEALARCFTVEFNEMWGSSTDTPDSNASRFGSRKANNTPHLFNINGITVRQYFSPSDRLVNQLLPIIESANHSLAFCIYDFTQPAVEQKMRIQREQNINFKVRGVFDYENSSHEENLYKKYKNIGNVGWQPPADVWTWRKSDLLHHKYLIADADFPTSAPAVVTGSYNWTITAERENDENILIIQDANIANQFLQEFYARYNESGGTNSVARQNMLPDACFLLQNFPNPFNGTTQIRYQINQATHVTLKIYNLAGQDVKTLVSEDKKAGDYLVDWTGTDFSDQLVSSGVYIYQLKTGDIIQNRKLLLIK
jgi:phosphatidylserine/phosphatidylglycerophosphate/cardiolipin synthase-like enzyme